MGEEVSTFLRGYGFEEPGDSLLDLLEAARVCLSQECRELGERLLDRVQVWTVGRQIEQLRGSVRISVYEAFSVSPPIGQVTVSGEWPTRQARMLADPCSLVRSRATVPPSRPGIPSGIARRRGQIRRLRRDRSHAQPPLGGEHGEDPQFDRAEHDAMLRPREALF